MNKIVYDFEVFKEDWLVVLYNYDTKEENLIVNSKEELLRYYNEHKNDIWIGYNNTHYDQYIFKGILLGKNPKKINDFIIIEKENPKFSIPKNDIQMYNFDLSNKFRSLKELEGFMGSKIKESDVSFNLNRKLTDEELKEVIVYCKHDVQQTVLVYENLKQELDSHLLMIDTFNLSMNMFEKSKAQLSAHILQAKRDKYYINDEFNLTFPDTLILNKYKEVLDWYKNTSNRNYKKKLLMDVGGVPTVFGWGGLHSAIPSYFGEGEFILSDIASMYPAIMIEYNYLSRNVKEKEKYREIRDRRIELKKTKDPKQAPLKIVLNSTYGASKDKYNELYDPLMANNVCITGQLLLLDLAEKVEPYCKIIQLNTDGILVKIEDPTLKNKYLEECDKWSKRVRLDLEHDKYKKIIQKDVNNYIAVELDDTFKAKGMYVKKLNMIDYDLPIVNEAVVNNLIYNTPIEETILQCDELIKFQKIVKITGKYKGASHNNVKLKEKVFRVFASNDERDGSIYKIKGVDKFEKIANTPINCFIMNENVKNEKCTHNLDKLYYIDIANDRIDKFKNNEFKFKIDSGIKFVKFETLEFVDTNIDKYDNFIEFLKILIQNSNSREREVLIKIDYFNKYGSIKKLLAFYDWFKILTKRKTFKKEGIDKVLELYIKDYSDITEKLYKNLQLSVILENIWNNLPNDEIEFIEKISYQLSLLGYISSEIPDNISIGKVNMVSSKYRSINVQSMRNQQSRWFKIPKNTGMKLPSKEDYILINKISKKTNWKGRTDWVIENYKKINEGG